jgi:2-polyprenyl-3-methyl-5-hydroxy-6-metoxy-1,4-benzoquinol methylase
VGRGLYQRFRRALHLDATSVPLINRELMSVSNHVALLDVGCGDESPIRKVDRKDIFRVGVDVYAPCLRKSKGQGIHDEYVAADASALPFREKSFDVALALEVLEHLPHDKGIPFMSSLKSIARSKVIISTPNGYMKQHGDENPYQTHLSGWSISELQEMGFRVKGIEGLRGLRDIHASLCRNRGHSKFFKIIDVMLYLLADITEPMIISHPLFAEALFGVMKI